MGAMVEKEALAMRVIRESERRGLDLFEWVCWLEVEVANIVTSLLRVVLSVECGAVLGVGCGAVRRWLLRLH